MVLRFSVGSFNFLLLTSCFLLSSCVSNHPIVQHETSVYIMNDSAVVTEDSIIKSEIAPYKTQLDKEMSVVLAISEQAMMKDNPEGLLGNFTSDAVLKKSREYCKDSCKVDFCVLNNGGLRNSLPKGNITKYDIFSLMPFENEIILLTLSGDAVKELMDFIANKKGMPVAGLRMKIKNQMASDVMIGDKPFDIMKSYAMVTSDYLAGGGDNMTFFSGAIRKLSLNKKIRDAIMEYLTDENKKGNTIKVKKDGRIQFE